MSAAREIEMKGLFFKALTIGIGPNSIFTIGLNYSSVKLKAGCGTMAALFSGSIQGFLLTIIRECSNDDATVQPGYRCNSSSFVSTFFGQSEAAKIQFLLLKIREKSIQKTLWLWGELPFETHLLEFWHQDTLDIRPRVSATMPETVFLLLTVLFALFVGLSRCFPDSN